MKSTEFPDIESILDFWRARIESSPTLQRRMQGVFGIETTEPKVEQWVFRTLPPLGFSRGMSSVGCNLRATLETFAQIASGELNPQVAFLLGKIEVRGDFESALCAHRFMYSRD